jgi:hypothetical protein
VQILNAASRCFPREGLPMTTMDDIIRAPDGRPGRLQAQTATRWRDGFRNDQPRLASGFASCRLRSFSMSPNQTAPGAVVRRN